MKALFAWYVWTVQQSQNITPTVPSEANSERVEPASHRRLQFTLATVVSFIFSGLIGMAVGRTLGGAGDNEERKGAQNFGMWALGAFMGVLGAYTASRTEQHDNAPAPVEPHTVRTKIDMPVRGDAIRPVPVAIAEPLPPKPAAPQPSVVADQANYHGAMAPHTTQHELV